MPRPIIAGTLQPRGRRGSENGKGSGRGPLGLDPRRHWFAAGHNGSAIRVDPTGAQTDASRARSLSIIGLSVTVAAIILVVLIRTNGGFVGSAAGSPPPTNQGTATPPSTTPAEPPTLTAEPTDSAAPAPTLAGEFPGPDATVPANVEVLPGLDLAAVTGLWQSQGMTCESHFGGVPDSGGGFDVHCERHDDEADVDVTADALYWTTNGVQAASISVNPISADGTLDGSAVADEWIIPFASLVGGEDVATWAQSHAGSESCRLGCSEVVSGYHLEYDSGSRGGQELFVER